MRKLFAVAVIAAGGGCSVFGWDDFTSDPDAPADGGGANDGDPGSIDGATDSIIPVGDGSGGDGGPSGPFCKTTGSGAALCDDFEEPGTFTGRWPEQDNYLGSLEVKDGIGFAGTRGLEFSATPVANDKNGRVILGWVTPSVASSIDAEVAVKLTSLPPTGYLAGPLYIQMDGYKGGYARLGFNLDGTGALVINPVVFPPNGGTAVSSGMKTVTTLAVGTWTRIRMVVDLGKSPPSAYAYVDGALKQELPLVDFEPATVNVRIGAQFVGTVDGGTIGMVLDDARASWK